MEFTKEQTNRIYRLNEELHQEFSSTDYFLFNAIKKVFKLNKINFAEYLIIKNIIEKIIKEKRIS